MSRLIRALKFAHSPRLMKPALVHTPPRIRPSQTEWSRHAGCRVHYQNTEVATKTAMLKTQWDGEEARLAQSQGCAQFHSIIPVPVATGAMQSSL